MIGYMQTKYEGRKKMYPVLCYLWGTRAVIRSQSGVLISYPVLSGVIRTEQDLVVMRLSGVQFEIVQVSHEMISGRRDAVFWESLR